MKLNFKRVTEFTKFYLNKVENDTDVSEYNKTMTKMVIPTTTEMVKVSCPGEWWQPNAQKGRPVSK